MVWRQKQWEEQHNTSWSSIKAIGPTWVSHGWFLAHLLFPSIDLSILVYGRVFQRSGGVVFFSSSLADVALWLGPYMSISSKTSICTRTKRVRKCRQITTNQTTHRPARRPANPPARLAFRQEKQQTRHTKGAGAQTKNTHQKDLPKDTVV